MSATRIERLILRAWRFPFRRPKRHILRVHALIAIERLYDVMESGGRIFTGSEEALRKDTLRTLALRNLDDAPLSAARLAKVCTLYYPSYGHLLRRPSCLGNLTHFLSLLHALHIAPAFLLFILSIALLSRTLSTQHDVDTEWLAARCHPLQHHFSPHWYFCPGDRRSRECRLQAVPTPAAILPRPALMAPHQSSS